MAGDRLALGRESYVAQALVIQELAQQLRNGVEVVVPPQVEFFCRTHGDGSTEREQVEINTQLWRRIRLTRVAADPNGKRTPFPDP